MTKKKLYCPCGSTEITYFKMLSSPEQAYIYDIYCASCGGKSKYRGPVLSSKMFERLWLKPMSHIKKEAKDE